MEIPEELYSISKMDLKMDVAKEDNFVGLLAFTENLNLAIFGNRDRHSIF